eukprot:COSAG06_NODE_5957_length_3186_cov_2.570781_2_plen_326_part_00
MLFAATPARCCENRGGMCAQNHLAEGAHTLASADVGVAQGRHPQYNEPYEGFQVECGIGFALKGGADHIVGTNREECCHKKGCQDDICPDGKTLKFDYDRLPVADIDADSDICCDVVRGRCGGNMDPAEDWQAALKKAGSDIKAAHKKGETDLLAHQKEAADKHSAAVAAHEAKHADTVKQHEKKHKDTIAHHEEKHEKVKQEHEEMSHQTRQAAVAEVSALEDQLKQAKAAEQKALLDKDVVQKHLDDVEKALGLEKKMHERDVEMAQQQSQSLKMEGGNANGVMAKSVSAKIAELALVKKQLIDEQERADNLEIELAALKESL